MSLLQVQSPVDSDALSPVERTAAWVLSNGQYEEAEEDSEQNADGVKHAEKVGFTRYTADLRAASESRQPHGQVPKGCQVLLRQSHAVKRGLDQHNFCCPCCHT